MLYGEMYQKKKKKKKMKNSTFLGVNTWVKVFRIDTEFRIGEVARGHFCKSRKSEEKLLGVWGRGYDRLVMNLDYLVFKIEQRKMKKKKASK